MRGGGVIQRAVGVSEEELTVAGEVEVRATAGEEGLFLGFEGGAAGDYDGGG